MGLGPIVVTRHPTQVEIRKKFQPKSAGEDRAASERNQGHPDRKDACP